MTDTLLPARLPEGLPGGLDFAGVNARIPSEIGEEKRTVAARHASPQPLLFPAAVVSFVPPKPAEGGRR